MLGVPGGQSRESPRISFAPKTLLDKHKGCFKDIICPQRWREGRAVHGGVGTWSTNQTRPTEPQARRLEVPWGPLPTLLHRRPPLPQPSRRWEIYSGGYESESLDWGTWGTIEVSVVILKKQEDICILDGENPRPLPNSVSRSLPLEAGDWRIFPVEFKESHQDVPTKWAGHTTLQQSSNSPLRFPVNI